MTSLGSDLVTDKSSMEQDKKKAVGPMADFEKAVQEMAESNGIFYKFVEDERKDFIRNVCAVNTWIFDEKHVVLNDEDYIGDFKQHLNEDQCVELYVLRYIIMSYILKFIKQYENVPGLVDSECTTLKHTGKNVLNRLDLTASQLDEILMDDIKSMLARFEFNQKMAQLWTENEKKKLEKDSKNKNEAGPMAEHNDTTRGASHDTGKEAKKEIDKKEKKRRYDLQDLDDEAGDTRPDTDSDPAPKKEKEKKEKKKRRNLQSCDKEAGDKPDHDVALDNLSQIQNLLSWPMTQEKANDLKKIQASMECMGFDTQRKGFTYPLYTELKEFNDIIRVFERRKLSYTSKEYNDTFRKFSDAQNIDPFTVPDFIAKTHFIYQKAKGGK
jgi:hypothetical protein